MKNWLQTLLSLLLPYFRKNIEDKEDAKDEAKKWKKMATLDDLTGLPNRLCFKFYWKKAIEKATVVIVDIDFFKTVNDKYGHAKGNEVLIRVARVLEKSKTYFVARYGGEEFLIVFNGKTKNSSIMKQMQQLKDAVEAEMLDYGVTVSMGISLSGSDFDRLFEQADIALYESKKNGRNKITTYYDVTKPKTAHIDKNGEIKKK